jgi:peptide/nickel transport system substrate-binding protein
VDDRLFSGRDEVGFSGGYSFRLGSRCRTTPPGACGFLLFIGLALAACSAPPANRTERTVILRIGIPEAAISAPDMGLSQAVRFFNVEGLTTKGADGRPSPRLAKSWQSSADGLTWRFLLKDNITFHDGTKLNASIVAQSLLDSLQRPGTRALYPGLLDILDIKAAAEHELIITLRNRAAFLLDDLEFPITLPSKDKTTIGTGPFKVISETPKEIVLAPHRAYHQGSPKIDRVVITAYPTLRTAWASMMRQEIDVLFDMAHDSAEFVQSSNVAFYSYLRYYVHLIAFNSARQKLAVPAVRRALNAAIDRARLIRDVLRGHGVPANGPLWPFHWAYDSTLPGYTYDPSLAAAIFDAAGVPRSGTSRSGLPARLSFVCLVPQNYAVLERMALGVQKQLYDIGIDMQLEAVSAEEYNVRIRNGDFDAVMVDMISGPVFARAYDFWRSTSGFEGMNVFGYRSAAADRWFDALRYAAGEAEYRSAASQLQRTLLEDPPALFLAWEGRTRVVSRRFKVPTEKDQDPIPTLWQWTPQDEAIPVSH